MEKHINWIGKIVENHGKNLNKEEAEKILEAETAKKYAQVLEDAGVYKNTENGHKGFERFLESMGINSIKF
jgi:UDPglucose--hexose-1-phosphate uridylyltransferase